MALNLHKFDKSGNLIKEWLSIAATGTGLEQGLGIETDKDDLWFVMNDGSGSSTVVRAGKDGVVVKSQAASSTKDHGITTDGHSMYLSSNGGGAQRADKSMNLIQSLGGTIYTGLSHDGKSIYGISGTTIEVISTNGGAVERSYTPTVSGTGVCCVGDGFWTIEGMQYMREYSHSGVLKKSITLPKFGTYLYTDLCHDEMFFWVISYSPVDVEPPI